MKLIDLSVSIDNNTRYFPGDPKPSIKPFITVEEDGCNVMSINISTHMGTHVDAPSHYIKNGKSIDQIPLNNFMGRAVVVNLSNLKPCHIIEPEDFDSYENDIKSSDIILFNTNWIYKNDDEFYNHPYLSKRSAEYIVKMGIKAIGVDMLNIDKTDSSYDMSAHDVILSNNILIVENLINLDKLNRVTNVAFFPLNIKGGDGSPVRAVAFEN